MKKLLIMVSIVGLVLVGCGIGTVGTNLQPRPKSLDKLIVSITGGNDLGYTSSIKMEIVSDKANNNSAGIYDLEAKYGDGINTSYDGYMAYVGDVITINVNPSQAHDVSSVFFNDSYYYLEDGVVDITVTERDMNMISRQGNYITVEFNIKDSYIDEPTIVDDVYEITTSKELRWVAAQAQRGEDFEDKTIKLMNDIDMENIDFTGIATGTSSIEFAGNFDGGGYEIKNLKINLPVSYVGLIGELSSSGSIKNLSISGSITSSGNYVGGIAGISYGLIENVINQASIKGSDYVGGIIGKNSGSANNCLNAADVTGESYVGGILGLTYGDVMNLANTGVITGYKYVSQIAHYYPDECTIGGEIIREGSIVEGVHVSFDE